MAIPEHITTKNLVSGFSAERVTPEELRQYRLFQGESPDMLDGVPEVCSVFMANAGDVLIEPDQINNDLYILSSGCVVVKIGRDDEVPIAMLERGDCLGEMSIIGSCTSSTWVIAVTECRLIRIPAIKVWALINRSANVPRNLLYSMCARIKHSNDIILKTMLKQRQIEEESRVDVLTNLKNRRWLEESLPRYIRRHRFSGQPLSVIMIDIDHFKKYNDNYGHHAGDMALKSSANCIQNSIRPSDEAARYGGEEFVVILPDATLKNARLVATRLLASIADNNIFDHDGASPLPGVTASLGIATLQPGQDVIDLLRQCDAALYKAKELGRNRVCDSDDIDQE
ncbi:MAG: GGDEF domain-containing protein [Gammaproteobacteria bacterium]|nr:GGDEF domain-containing protein [Gammaproteobacteria bacterium]